MFIYFLRCFRCLHSRGELMRTKQDFRSFEGGQREMLAGMGLVENEWESRRREVEGGMWNFALKIYRNLQLRMRFSIYLLTFVPLTHSLHPALSLCCFTLLTVHIESMNNQYLRIKKATKGEKRVVSPQIMCQCSALRSQPRHESAENISSSRSCMEFIVKFTFHLNISTLNWCGGEAEKATHNRMQWTLNGGSRYISLQKLVSRMLRESIRRTQPTEIGKKFPHHCHKALQHVLGEKLLLGWCFLCHVISARSCNEAQSAEQLSIRQDYGYGF